MIVRKGPRDAKPYEGGAPYIFVSYAHADKERVLPYIAALESAGAFVWFDEGIRAGYEWENEIISHLSGCAYFLFFVSQRSLASDNCKDELYSAREKNKPFVNVLIEDIDLDKPELEWFKFRYSRYQMLFAYAKSVDEIVSAVIKAFGIKPAPVKPDVFTTGRGREIHVDVPRYSTPDPENISLADIADGQNARATVILGEPTPAAVMSGGEDDPLLPAALWFTIKQNKASLSLIQRVFSIGYARASRLMDTMELAGYIGPHKADGSRDILITEESYKQIFGGQGQTP